MAFTSYEFTYAGESSLEHGLMIYDIDGKNQSDVSFGNTADIIETRTNRRIQPLFFGVNYNKKSLEFKLVFGAFEPLDRYQLEEISLWLTGYQTPQWLTIDQPDLEGIQFKCLITQLTPISIGWLQYAFEATIVCDCSYAYSLPFEKTYTISGETEVLFRNESTVREYFKPYMTFAPASGTTSLSIVNESDNDREFLLTGIPASSVITVDNNNGIIRETVDNTNLYPGFNYKFLRLVHGDNHLVITGNGTLTISGRFFHNVAG